MTKLFKNCYCLSKTQHLRELDKDFQIIFKRVDNGSNEFNRLNEIQNEIQMVNNVT